MYIEILALLCGPCVSDAAWRLWKVAMQGVPPFNVSQPPPGFSPPLDLRVFTI
jgi:hypothetical protein